MKIILYIFIISIFSGCINKHGIAIKYYSECKEYYDLQGFYHKKCGKDDILTYDSIFSIFHENNNSKKQKNIW